MSREAIDQARAEITTGWLNSDPDAIMNHVTDDARFLGPHQPRVDGAPAVRAWLERFFSEVKMTRVDMVDDRDVVLSGELAVERSSYDWESTLVGGDEVFTDQGNFIGVWQRQGDGTWKESCIMWNSWKPAS